MDMVYYHQEVERMNNIIGENIKRKRKELNMTQCQLAEIAEVTQAMIAQIERGSKVPSMPLGAQIAKALNCGIADLY